MASIELQSTIAIDSNGGVRQVNETADCAQAFFESYAASVMPPHVSNEHKLFVREMLNLAETAGLYRAPERK